tara:strand:- start:867 stop:2825 length:1959 start_codon:yes stop_codon:yes gene_type:complete
MLRTWLLQWWLVLSLIAVPLSALANDTDNTTTTTTTTVPDTTTTTIPGEVEEVETFDGPLEEEVEEETTETTTTTTTIPEWEQSTDIELPEDELNSQGNEVENNIQIDDKHSNGNWSCCGMTDFHMNLHYFQHGNDSNDYTFTLPETTTVDEEELEIDIYEVGFRIGALNNDGTVTYTHTDETTQVNVLEGQDNTDIENMFEDVVYNIYDTLETFIESFTITINDWSLLDDISFKYIQPTTTTTTLPPPPEPEPEPFIPPPPPEPEIFVVVLDDGTEAEYQQHEIDDGTVERDNQRKKNLEIYGVELTDEQIERGDLEQYDIEIIEETDMEELGEEFFDDVNIPDVDEDRYEDEPKYQEDEEEDIDDKVREFDDTILEVEEFLEEFEEVQIIIIEDIEIDLEDIKIEEDKSKPKEDIEIIEKVIEDENIIEVLPLEDTTEEVEEILTEEMVDEKVAELEEVIEIEEDLTDEEVAEAIEVFVQELDTEEVVEVLEEVNDIGVQNLDQATEEVQEVVQAVVEEAIEDVAELTEEQVEVVAEVLQVQAEDVEIIAEAVKEDEVVAEAVEEYVERAVENADVENYTLADVVTEVQFETFLDNPIETFIDIDLTEINIANIGDDMTQDQKEKAQEVVVPVILTRIATMAAFVFRKTI